LPVDTSLVVVVVVVVVAPQTDGRRFEAALLR